MNLSLPRLLPTSLLGFALLLLAACESGPDRRGMEEARRSIPPMAASDTYFDGKLTARLTLGNTLGRMGPGQGPGPRGGGHRGGGPRGGGHHGGMEGMGGEGPGGRPEQFDAGSSQEMRPRYVDSPMPPTMLRLQLENTSAEPVTVEITDLDSELGNFATRPDKFTLAPGAVGEPNAMQSLLGLESLALPVKLTLRVGGKAESKTLILRPVAPDATSPATN